MLVVVPALQTLFLQWRDEAEPDMQDDENDLAEV
jgi:hypothetical protein